LLLHGVEVTEVITSGKVRFVGALRKRAFPLLLVQLGLYPFKFGNAPFFQRCLRYKKCGKIRIVLSNKMGRLAFDSTTKGYN